MSLEIAVAYSEGPEGEVPVLAVVDVDDPFSISLRVP